MWCWPLSIATRPTFLILKLVLVSLVGLSFALYLTYIERVCPGRVVRFVPVITGNHCLYLHFFQPCRWRTPRVGCTLSHLLHSWKDSTPSQTGLPSNDRTLPALSRKSGRSRRHEFQSRIFRNTRLLRVWAATGIPASPKTMAGTIPFSISTTDRTCSIRPRRISELTGRWTRLPHG